VPQLQLPRLQLSVFCGAQASQVRPPVPHLLAVGGLMQVVPEQQPLGHEVGSHLQVPLTQCCPALQGAVPLAPQTQAPDAHVFERRSQATQPVPPIPQAVGSAVLHTPPTQHPPAQLVESQPLPLHTPPVQVPDEQV
jgi:hypothetical protein